ncbi:MAG: GTPase [candidate division WOR-3 bacterium]
MPANLPPQYHAAYQKYREAKTIEEKIAALKEMWAVMPKHKGTDKLQAEIKRKLAQLKEELELEKKRKKGGGFQFPEREGAGQACLLGPPNSGKSSLLKVLTNANPEIADYPFTTQTIIPGMMPYEDIKIQIVDLPPFTGEEVIWWQREVVRMCDLVLFILDISKDDLVDDFEKIKSYLETKNIFLIGKNVRKEEEFGGPAKKRTILVFNKFDVEGANKRFESIKEFFEKEYDLIPISCKNLYNIDSLKEMIFKNLEIIRVYTKEPGKPPDLTDPLILPLGSKVIDAAYKLHKDFAEKLKHARIWGSSKFGGQRVPKDYILKDKDIVEFHI